VTGFTELTLCYITVVMSETSGRRRSRREERKEETRAELIQAARKVFARRGFEGASLVEVAEEAGFSTGAIYWHFTGKDDLFLAVFEDFAAERMRSAAESDEQQSLREAPLPERARAFADQWMARERREPEFLLLWLEFLLHAQRKPALKAEFAQRVAFGRLAAARFLDREAKADGVELPLPVDEVAAALRELGIGLALARLVDPDGIPARLFGDFVESYFEMIVGQQRASTAVRAGKRSHRRKGQDG
jgi:AcrR family transcriptional regulator